MMKPAGSPTTPVDVRRLVQEHQVGLWRYLRAMGCPPEMAEDLVQETFLTVLQHPFYEVDRTATRAYLRRVAKNLLVTYLRRNGRVTFLDHVEAADMQWQQWANDDDGEQLLAALRECLQQLTDRVRGALEMRFRDKRSRQQIAAALNMTEHGAKNLLQRAKKKLRQCIEGKLS